MKKFLLRAVVLALVLVPAALFFHYFLPRSVIVEISQTDVRRLDNDNNRVGQSSVAPGETRDVFFISAAVPGSDEVLVFRNEDTEFACPPCYFKFNDSDINALAAKLANEKATAKITYYGFRIQLLSMWPNVISVERAEIGASTFPLARIIILSILGALVGFAYWKLRGLFGRLFGKAKA